MIRNFKWYDWLLASGCVALLVVVIILFINPPKYKPRVKKHEGCEYIKFNSDRSFHHKGNCSNPIHYK